MAKKAMDFPGKSRIPASGSPTGADPPCFPLPRLHLDKSNPRLGAEAGKIEDEAALVDRIVDVFGVDDLLSSLAVNGYFAAEPLVGVRMPGSNDIRIAEGNRRLAACLILAGDKRARRHQRRTTQYQALQQQHDRSPITEVPVRIVDDDESLLSYLGVRHIAGTYTWDSYAKAAWVARVLEKSDLTVDDVSQMIGDQHRTIPRSLESYYLVNQLRKTARFNPGDSERLGRGSNPEYPFSWIYTAVGYAPIREWLGLKDVSLKGRNQEPIRDAQTLLSG